MHVPPPAQVVSSYARRIVGTNTGNPPSTGGWYRQTNLDLAILVPGPPRSELTAIVSRPEGFLMHGAEAGAASGPECTTVHEDPDPPRRPRQAQKDPGRETIATRSRTP
jgi:hypothetical protein